jgi:O-antigen ligase
MFGGKIYWSTLPLSIWGTIGGALTLRLLMHTGTRRRRFIWWLAPFVALNTIILVGTLNPAFSEFIFFGERSLRPISHLTWLPTSAMPKETLLDLWLYNGIYLSAFNLLIGIKRRRALRQIALILTLNCSALAVFGTIQHFAGTDIFFGLEHSPNQSFFATFIYHNHWGGYAMVTSALGLGLVGHHLNDRGQRNFWHSPGFAISIPVMLVAISIPLSSSRSSTLAELGLAAISAGYLLKHFRRRFRHHQSARYGAYAGIVLAGALALGAIYYLAKPVIERRIAETVQQLKKEQHYAFAASEKLFYAESRFRLYEDTVNMIKAKPIWGWGFGSYGYVFPRYNSQSAPATRWPIVFIDAHSDWLEALAEVGLVGTILLVGMVIGPLWLVGLRIFSCAFSGFVFTGASMLALYALIEFPFANPAVILSFWTVLFLSLRYAGLEIANAKESKSSSNTPKLYTD